MSYISWTTQDDEVTLSGRERHYGKYMSNRLFMLAVDATSPARIQALNTMMRGWGRNADSEDKIRPYLSGIDDEYFVLNGASLPAWTTALNTALVMGSDAVKLLARLHGQCEVHAYVEGPNRKWLADIIRQGLEDKVLHGGCNWEGVITLLECSTEGAVVTSYSVTEGFPDSSLSTYADDDEWYDLPEDVRWNICMDALRADGKSGLELKPENWDQLRFDQGHSAFDIKECVDAITKEK